MEHLTLTALLKRKPSYGTQSITVFFQHDWSTEPTSNVGKIK